MSTIRKSLLHSLFSGFSMRRWNDKLRPAELYEVDKQAHKMIVAFLLIHTVKCESDEQRDALCYDIVEASLFDYFYRLVITDLKPPLFYKIKKNKEHYNELTTYVENILNPILAPFSKQFFEHFKEYHRGERKFVHPLTKDILDASHLFASHWEFNLIASYNTFDTEIPNIGKDFIVKLEKLSNKKGMKGLKSILDKDDALGAFAHFCGQLRFQIRWSQEQRMPTTSVLGHMFFVAALAFFVSYNTDACKKRTTNNFFCGLFHDLPELLTRDIISPVKNSSDGLPAFIHHYENHELEERILKPLRNAGYKKIVDELSYLLGLKVGGEFKNCYISKGKIINCEFSKLAEHNSAEYNPKDGELLKSCDILAAFMEAHTSIRLGISSEQLVRAIIRMRETIPNPYPEKIDFKALLADFD